MIIGEAKVNSVFVDLDVAVLDCSVFLEGDQVLMQTLL